MTVKAAREAALGAGGNIRWITAGTLSPTDIATLKTTPLNMILIAGGLDYGEANTALANARIIASLRLSIPVVYAGNVVNQPMVKAIFEEANQSAYLFLTDNVYPKIDQLEVAKVREIIQQAFERHIVEAPGMERIPRPRRRLDYARSRGSDESRRTACDGSWGPHGRRCRRRNHRRSLRDGGKSKNRRSD
ncbi:MAG: glutamate mutase L [Bacillus subtilis]|nr:glutamate mutase L [Bacillus subtilis]